MKKEINRNDFTIEKLNELRDYFSYNPESGDLIKIKKTSKSDTRSVLFVPITKTRSSNNTSQNDDYICIIFNKQSFVGHRIAYMLHYNEILLGTDIIDHIDGNTLNNKISNLRKTTHTGNMTNQKIRTNNSTGVTGVKKTQYNTYMASIEVNKKRITKTFTTFEEAKLCREAWNVEYGFKTNDKK